MTDIIRISAFVLGLISFGLRPAYADLEDPSGDNSEAQLNQVINSCVTANVRDPICDGLVKLRNVGDDFIESVKEFADLTPRQYFLLTLTNALIQKRIRVRTRIPSLAGGQYTVDLQEEESTVILEFSF